MSEKGMHLRVSFTFADASKCSCKFTSCEKKEERRKKRVEKKEEKMFNEFTGNGRVVVSGRYASASTQLAMEFVEVVRVRMQVRISTVSGDGCSDSEGDLMMMVMEMVRVRYLLHSSSSRLLRFHFY